MSDKEAKGDMVIKIHEESLVRVMTVKDVANYLNISVSKVYFMANANQIPAFRVGKSWRFKRDQIDTWIQQTSNTVMVE